MPELPEAETIKKDLQKYIIGKKIVGVEVFKPKLVKEPFLEEFKKGVIGQSPQKILRRAKVLIIQLKRGRFLIIHLRISGWLFYGEPKEKSRAVFKFSDGNALNYMDQRVLGELRLRNNYSDLKFIKNLGPELFNLSYKDFSEIVRKKKTRIKVLLMDQAVIAGIGNIYAQEVLFRARISPLRKSNTLTEPEIKLLYKNLIKVLKEAVQYGGSSIDAYRDIQGNKGGMEKRLKIYGKKGELCPECNCSISKITVGSRGTCFCPHCQK